MCTAKKLHRSTSMGFFITLTLTSVICRATFIRMLQVNHSKFVHDTTSKWFILTYAGEILVINFLD